MSEPKRPGTSKDISELKARLGLKKAAPAPQAKNGQQGVVPPPGVMPKGPAVPNAAEDPFAAMNAMASIGTMQRAPEIVIVNDGRPVESVGAGKRAAVIGKYAALALVPLIVGLVLGQTIKENKIYNAGIADAGQVLDAKEIGVKSVKRKVAELQAVLEDSAKSNFAPSQKTTASLKGLLKTLEVKSDAIYRAKQNTMGATLSGEVLAFYSGVAEVQSLLKQHVELAEVDDKFLIAAQAAADAAKSPFGYKYGVVIVTPPPGTEGGTFGAKLVEVAINAGQVQYREDLGQYINAEAQTSGSSGEPKKVIPLLQTTVAENVIKKGEPGAADLFYTRRLAALKKRVDDLIKQGNSLEQKLSPKAKESNRFTFFM